MRDGGGRNRGGSTRCFRAAAAGAQGRELLRAQGERPGEGGRVKVGVHHVGGGVESAGRGAFLAGWLRFTLTSLCPNLGHPAAQDTVRHGLPRARARSRVNVRPARKARDGLS